MARVTAQTIQVAGRPARVWLGGAGPTLLLLHGGVGDAELHWRAVWDKLGATFSVAAPDWPGFGGTAPLPNASFGTSVEWTARLLSTLGVSRAVVVGNSFGAAIARLFAARHLERVERLVLVNGGQVIHVPRLVQLLIRSPLGAPLFAVSPQLVLSLGLLRRAFADPAHLTPEFVAAVRRSLPAFAVGMRQVATGGVPEEQTPRVPTLVLWGASDRWTTPEEGKKIAAQIPGAAFQLVEGAGHLPQIERPDEFVAAVQQFCGR